MSNLKRLFVSLTDKGKAAVTESHDKWLERTLKEIDEGPAIGQKSKAVTLQTMEIDYPLSVAVIEKDMDVPMGSYYYAKDVGMAMILVLVPKDVDENTITLEERVVPKRKCVITERMPE